MPLTMPTDGFRRDAQALASLHGWIYAFTWLPALHVVVRLGVADRLRGRAMTAAELAVEVGAHAGSLERLLGALAANGVFERAGDRFGLTPMGEHLCRDHPDSVYAAVAFEGSPMSWRAWEHLEGAVRDGRSAFEHAHGAGLFDYLQRHRDDSRRFNDAMDAYTRRVHDVVLARYDFSGVGTVVDVGGGHGELLCSLLERYPEMRGVVMDLPTAVSEAAGIERPPGVAARLSFHGGSFFEEMVEGGDVYIMKGILHDWDDERCRRILGRCRAALRPGGRVLAIERVQPTQGAGGDFSDLAMMCLTPGGRERSEDELRALFASAGLELDAVLPIGRAEPTSRCILVGVPA